MLHEIGTEIQTTINGRLCPLPVVDGPEPTDTVTFARERIVLEYDPSGDSFAVPRAQRPNPSHRMTRLIGCKLTIYAQEVTPNAMAFEHRRRAEHILDQVLVALYEGAAQRANQLEIVRGAFVQPIDLAGSPVQGGAVYELYFKFGRAVFTQDFPGNIAPTGTVGPGGIGVVTVAKATRYRPGDSITVVPSDAETVG